MQHIRLVLGEIEPFSQRGKRANRGEDSPNHGEKVADLGVLHHNLFIFFALYEGILGFARNLFGLLRAAVYL